MAETSPARLQSCFGSLCVNLIQNCIGTYALGHFPLTLTIQLEHHKLDPCTNVLHPPPQNSAVQGYLNAVTTAPLVCGGVLYETLLHCCETNTRVPFHSGKRSSKTDSAKTLNAALGTNLN